MTDEQINEQPAPETEDEPQPETEQPAAAATDNDGWHTELVLEAQRYVMKVTAPDGSIHICHSPEELEKLKAERGK